MSTLDNLRKSAKRWLKALRAGDAEARARLSRAHPTAAIPYTLRDVQHALARERGFESWIALTAAIGPSLAEEPLLPRLLTAAGRGDASAVGAILDEHPSIVDERGLLSGNTGLRTALHFGVGHEAVVRTLLEHGANPNIRDDGDNAFPLHFAAERGDLAVVSLLVEHGADTDGAGTVHQLDIVGWAVCFEYAMHVDVARYLLAHGAPFTLWTAVALGEGDIVRRIANGGADVNARMDGTNHRRTPLHLAVIKKQPASLRALIELGADLNLEDTVGLTPLDQAALDGADDLCRLLLDAGASVTFPAAMALARSEDVERHVRTQPGILSDEHNRRWARLIVHASRRASALVLERLLSTALRHRAGLSIVNMQDDAETAVDHAEGYTALHAAAFSGNSAAAAVLLKHGANPRVRDRKYCGTPAGWAAYAGHHETARLILDADVDIFDAINFDRADRVAQILERDPAALDRPFKAYATCPATDGQWWPSPDCTPLEWAEAQKKHAAAGALRDRGAAERTTDQVRRAGRIVTFLAAACWDHEVHGKPDHRMCDRAAQRLLAADPSIAHDSLYTALVCGDLAHVEGILAARPEAARERGGARGWTPILYLTYTRFTHPATIENAVAIARALLDRGADPNDFYMAGDAQYTALVGAAGEGEQDSPRQPYAAALFQLLLERGADPFDIQVLYNTHFSGDVQWWLDLVYAHTVDGPRAAAWRDPEWTMFDMGGYGTGARFLLELAIKKHDVPLARWLLSRGANPNAAPSRDRRLPKHTLYELATLEHQPEIAELLAQHGAVRSTPTLNDDAAFTEACLRLDRDEARRLLAAHPGWLASGAPMFAAAGRDRPDALALLVDLGFDVNVQDGTGRRPLHEAAARGALQAAAFLIERGADVDPRESTYNGTPMGWASHGDRHEMIALLSRDSRDIWSLCFNGCVDRIRELLREDPALARQTNRAGVTPLWWLPDDDDKASAIVDLLLAAGADPRARNQENRTAADVARERGMFSIAARLEAASRSTFEV